MTRRRLLIKRHKHKNSRRGVAVYCYIAVKYIAVNMPKRRRVQKRRFRGRRGLKRGGFIITVPALISAGIAAAQAAALGAAGGIAIEKTVEAIKSTTKH